MLGSLDKKDKSYNHRNNDHGFRKLDSWLLRWLYDVLYMVLYILP